MTTLREAAQMALDALEHLQTDIEWQYKSPTRAMLRKVEKALRAALAQPEHEPVAYDVNGATVYIKLPIYTAPPQREWQGLTDDEITRLRHLYDPTAHWSLVAFAHAIESKLKEKNT